MRLLFAALLAALTAACWSQGPIPTPGELSQKQESRRSQPQQQQEGGQTEPGAIPARSGKGPLPGGKYEGQHATDGKQESPYERWLVWFTGALFGATLALVVATIYLVKATNKHGVELERLNEVASKNAEAATKAADVAEQALHTAQRAEIRFEPLHLENLSPLDVWVEIKNYGPTVGTATVGYTWSLNQELPEPIDFKDLGMPISLAGGESCRVTFGGEQIVERAKWDALNDGMIPFYLYGRVAYADVFDKRWVTTFCRKLIPRHQRGNDHFTSNWERYEKES